MIGTRSRLPYAAFGFIAGAAIGLKLVVLLGFVLGVKPSPDLDYKMVFACVWVSAFAAVFAALGAGSDTSRKKKPVGTTAGVGDRDLDGP